MLISQNNILINQNQLFIKHVMARTIYNMFNMFELIVIYVLNTPFIYFI